MVRVYSTKTCPWCTKVKDYLRSLGVEYGDVDVAADRAAAMEMVKRTQQMGVPVTEVGETFIVGYDPEAIRSALEREGLLPSA
jgi:glutaredoxin-like YruB-family protein